MNLQATKEEILRKVDIVQLIGEDVRLFRRGSNFVGLCPFHDEKTPSFTVSPDKQFFKCFGCGKSGNAITFVMEHYGLSFIEAMKMLASKVGVVFKIDKQETEPATKQSELLNAMEIATKFFEDNLFTSEGEHCLRYYNSRGFDNDIIKNFRLGYSPNSFNKLINFLGKKGISNRLALECGLIVQNENGKEFDRFRNRAMFPIQDLFGRTIAFGARLLEDDNNQAKYINSPQTPLYDKSRVLYGLFQAKNAIMKNDLAIITEGYADVITMHKYGFKNTISSSGTALTEHQLSLLSRYTKRILLLFDGDDAGVKAAERALTIALQNNFEVRILVLPEGHDPDSFLNKFGNAELNKLIDQDNNFLTFLINLHLKKRKLSSSAKTIAINRILEFIAMVPEELNRNFLIDEFTSKAGLENVQKKLLLNKLNELVGKKVTQQVVDYTEKTKQPKSADQQFEEQCQKLIKKLTKSEFAFYRFVLTNNETFKLLDKSKKFISYLRTKVAKRLYENLKLYKSLDELMIALDEPEFNPYLRNIIRTISLQSPKSSENWEKFSKRESKTSINYQFKVLMLNLEKDYIERKLSKIITEIKNISEDAEKLTFMERYKTLSERKEEIIKLLSEI